MCQLRFGSFSLSKQHPMPNLTAILHIIGNNILAILEITDK